jgi:hypothetical protein
VKSDRVDPVSEMLDAFIDIAPKPPRKDQLQHVYSRFHYNDRIKVPYEEEYGRLVAEAKARGDEKLPSNMNVRNRVRQRLWEAESEETKAEIAKIAEEEHQKKLEEWKESSNVGSKDRTPMEWHR